MSARDKQVLKRESAFERLRETLEVGLKAKKDPSCLARFQAYFSRVEITYNSFEENHFSLSLLAIDEESKEQDKKKRQEADQIYFDVLALHKEFTLGQQGESSEQEMTRGQTPLRLPKINLPVFSGEFKLWPSYRELYDSMIHRNDSLPKVEKFHYLLSSLSGEARNLIKGITLSASNYDEAYHILVDRYQDKRKLSFYYWEELQNYRLKGNGAKDLRKLLDSFIENTGLLRNLGFAIEGWDFVLFHLLLTKLDASTRQRFEQANGEHEIPSFATLIEFLKGYCQSLELSGCTEVGTRFNKPPKPTSSTSFMAQVQGNKETCSFCSASHNQSKCDQFLALEPQERYNLAARLKLCINCLKPGHRSRECKWSTCSICRKRHNTLLHFPKKPGSVLKPPVTSMTNIKPGGGTVLLATALVEVCDRHGNFRRLRALLDSGSQASFITRQGCKRLRLRPTKSRFTICGLGTQPSTVMASVPCKVRLGPVGTSAATELEVDSLVLPQICQDIPVSPIATHGWSVLKGINLADPGFACTTHVDMLLGAEVFAKVVTGRRKEGKQGEPTALETLFGWCLIGGYQDKTNSTQIVLHALVDSSLDTLVKRFWEIDSLKEDQPSYSVVDQEVEKYFQETVAFDELGRVTVALPFKMEPFFPGSKAIAVRRLWSLERKLSRDRNLRVAYNDFMKDYEMAGHMQLLPETFSAPESGYYLPHHPVLRMESSTTKLRVVFDASAKASNGYSLNDVVEIGPSLQLRIVAILLRFRIYRIGIMADIRQMYRQIWVQERDRSYQKIVWRENTDEPVRVYQLNTVTYGVAASPFLAIRSLHEIARRGQERYPEATEVLLRDVYMDDTVTGADELAQAEYLKLTLTQLLREHGFVLHKWASNCENLVGKDPNPGEGAIEFSDHESPHVKVLGLRWKTKPDVFYFGVQVTDDLCTKRSILSGLAKIFDPLGLISPVVFFVKTLFQRLWLLGIQWDEPAPMVVKQLWKEWLNGLGELQKVQVLRYIGFRKGRARIQLHGFCDASELGYAAVIYARSECNGQVRSTLLLSKTKVAPIKQKSIPRLELCAALLLTDLIVYVQKECEVGLSGVSVVAWTDSTTVLHWIRSRSVRFKPFVGHRVGRIQDALGPGTFRFVPTKDNPADIASRGTMPADLVASLIWWQGPSWLCGDPRTWPKCPEIPVPSEEVLEVKPLVCSISLLIPELLERFSSLQKLLRILAFCRRFSQNCKAMLTGKNRVGGPVSQSECQEVLLLLIRAVQASVFSRELTLLQTPRGLPKSLQALSLFLDSSGLLRVGGRLNNSELSYAKRFPLLLPRKHQLTTLIIRDAHRMYLHPGSQTLHFLLQQRYWILSARRAIRSVLSRCVPCVRTSPKPASPVMSALPPSRVQEAKAFLRVGVDFGGPFVVRPVRGRGRKVSNLYLCIFVCHSTKAIHLELVFGLTCEAFLAAWRRFVGRRGQCELINCDNGTNFVGAARIMKQLMKEASETEGVTFQFNPPRTPHFGGLFEAGIKSVKTHFNRVIGAQILTFEEFLTLTVQIEAVLNSRPLWATSSDPLDLTPLTPGHFLMVAPLTATADPDLTGRPANVLSRWQLVQALQQSFWARWRGEYLTTLQQRQKWRVGGLSVQKGSLVVLKEEQLKPRCWEMARVVELHPGADGVARVASVKTARGILKRPIVRLCPLPVISSEE